MKKELRVEYFLAKPNKMFPPQLTGLLRFVRYNQAVPCGLCGKRTKHHWTMVCPFGGADIESQFIAVQMAKETFAPGTPLCRDHLLEPRIPTKLWLGEG